MARNALSGINLGFHQLLGLRVENRADPPSNPQDGFVYYDTTEGAMRLYQGGVWVNLTPDVTAVEHGADATVPRPNATVVIWVGTVQPDNWTSADIWNDIS